MRLAPETDVHLEYDDSRIYKRHAVCFDQGAWWHRLRAGQGVAPSFASHDPWHLVYPPDWLDESEGFDPDRRYYPQSSIRWDGNWFSRLAGREEKQGAEYPPPVDPWYVARRPTQFQFAVFDPNVVFPYLCNVYHLGAIWVRLVEGSGDVPTFGRNDPWVFRSPSEPPRGFHDGAFELGAMYTFGSIRQDAGAYYMFTGRYVIVHQRPSVNPTDWLRLTPAGELESLEARVAALEEGSGP